MLALFDLPIVKVEFMKGIAVCVKKVTFINVIDILQNSSRPTKLLLERVIGFVVTRSCSNHNHLCSLLI